MILKRLTVACAAVLLGAVLSGCGRFGVSAGDDKLSVVCTIFPPYDWVRQILGGEAQNTELSFLLDNGIDLHSFQPSVSDISKISVCDLFIYTGGESDEWVEDALSSADPDNAETYQSNLAVYT